MDLDTVFVIVSDEKYYTKAKKTIADLRSIGEWRGDIVYISVGFNISNNFALFYNIREIKFPEIDKSEYLKKIGDGLPDGDDRILHKLTQWEKLHVFDSSFFSKWKRVIYLDAGLRILDSVKYLLELEYKGLFLCPDENETEEKRLRNVFNSQISKKDLPLREKLLSEYGDFILNENNFLNCIWIYDTEILKICSKEEMIRLMNDYPLFLTNEMGVMNLLIAMKYKLWTPFPKVASNGKYLFDWCELNRPGTSWYNYCLIKYPVSICFEDT